ncbi:MAG TPA: M23 family metallopeptidase, partial [Herpetosiphonaceae bacterium]
MLVARHQQRSLINKLLVLLSLLAISCLPVFASWVSARANRTTLETSVIQAVIAHQGTPAAEVAALEESIQVNTKRRDDQQRWAFGSVVIPAPAVEDVMPEGWLFVARETGNGWIAAVDGTPAFSALVRQAPETLVSSGERGPLAATGEVGTQAVATGLRLPWAVGQSWYMSGGPHGWSGSNTPYSSIDFSGGDQIVRAARGGRVYTMCSTNLGWLRIIHDNGYSTDYYHLWNNIKWADGSAISAGTRLGDTGTDVSCGGSATGRHVHFALRLQTLWGHGALLRFGL